VSPEVQTVWTPDGTRPDPNPFMSKRHWFGRPEGAARQSGRAPEPAWPKFDPEVAKAKWQGVKPPPAWQPPPEPKRSRFRRTAMIGVPAAGALGLGAYGLSQFPSTRPQGAPNVP
jgi:hypothetical protein